MEALIQRRSHVKLEWDSAQNKVVAPRSQVAISWSQASADPTKTIGSHSRALLVDGFGIPQELLELPNLKSILSVETWENCLTHSERELLSMYIPEGLAPESTVEALLRGENLHFGNPLEKWGQSVCSGDMHPDAILHRELKAKEERKAYTKRLRNYHGNLLRNVQNMKEIWEECENPEDVLQQIQRFGRSGQRSHGGHRKNVFQLSRKTVESADLKKRNWTEVGEGGDQARDMPTRPKAKKPKVIKLPDEGSKRLKIKPPELETERLKIKPLEGPSRVKTKPTGETADSGMRPKGRNVGQPEEGTKTLKVKSSDFGTKRLKIKSPEEGAKRLEVKPQEEGRKKGQLKPLQDETRRPKMKPSDEAVKILEMKSSGEGIKELKMKPSQGGAKTLKIKQSEDGRKKSEIKPAEEGSKRFHVWPADDKETAMRPLAKRLKVKPAEEGIKRLLEGQYGEEGTKKSQIRLSDAGRKPQHYQSLEEGKEPPSRAKAKRSRVKSFEQGGIQRTTIKVSDEGSKSRKNKPSRDGPKVLKMEPAEEVTRILPVKGPRGGKGVKVKPFKEAAQRTKILSPEEKNILPRPKEKKSKVQPSEQGTTKLNSKRAQKGREGHELGHSDFEGEWFKKYVLVTIGPLSGQRLSKAIQEVQVTTKILKDVKRRSEAGEEVHLDNLVPVEAPSKKKKASKKAVGPNKIEESIASFWQTVLIKEVPAVHARFMQRKEQMQKLAISLASSSKSLWDIEPEGAPMESSPSRGYASRSPGVASPDVEYASPSGGEPSLSEHEALPSGGEASPSLFEPSRTAVEGRSGGETSPSRDEPSASDGDPSASGTEASPSGGEASPNVVEAVQSGDEAWPSGDEAVPSGDEAVPSGDEALASDDEASRDDALGSGDGASPGEQSWKRSGA